MGGWDSWKNQGKRICSWRVYASETDVAMSHILVHSLTTFFHRQHGMEVYSNWSWISPKVRRCDVSCIYLNQKHIDYPSKPPKCKFISGFKLVVVWTLWQANSVLHFSILTYIHRVLSVCLSSTRRNHGSRRSRLNRQGSFCTGNVNFYSNRRFFWGSKIYLITPTSTIPPKVTLIPCSSEFLI